MIDNDHSMIEIDEEIIEHKTLRTYLIKLNYPVVDVWLCVAVDGGGRRSLCVVRPRVN